LKKARRPQRTKGCETVFQPKFLEDLRYWIRTDRRIALRVLDIVETVKRDPFRGVGKPEPLKHELVIIRLFAWLDLAGGFIADLVIALGEKLI